MDGKPIDANRNDRQALYRYYVEREHFSKEDAEELVKQVMMIIFTNEKGDHALIYRPTVERYSLLCFDPKGDELHLVSGL